MGAAINDFLGKPPTLVQPFEFPHNVHVAKKILIAGTCLRRSFLRRRRSIRSGSCTCEGDLRSVP